MSERADYIELARLHAVEAATKMDCVVQLGGGDEADKIEAELDALVVRIDALAHE